MSCCNCMRKRDPVFAYCLATEPEGDHDESHLPRPAPCDDMAATAACCRYLLDEDEEDWAFNNDSTLTVGRNF